MAGIIAEEHDLELRLVGEGLRRPDLIVGRGRRFLDNAHAGYRYAAWTAHNESSISCRLDIRRVGARSTTGEAKDHSTGEKRDEQLPSSPSHALALSLALGERHKSVPNGSADVWAC